MGSEKLTQVLQEFSNCFVPEKSEHPLANLAQGLYGYTSYDAVQFFDTVKFKQASPETDIPLMRYRLYQYVIAINHFNDEMTIFENKIKGLESDFLLWKPLSIKRTHLYFLLKQKMRKSPT